MAIAHSISLKDENQLNLKKKLNLALNVLISVLGLSSLYMMDDYSNITDNGPWSLRDGTLYKGDILIGDGKEEYANRTIFSEDNMLVKHGVAFECSVFVQASSLAPELSKSTFRPAHSPRRRRTRNITATLR